MPEASTTATAGVDAGLLAQRYDGLKPFAPAPSALRVKPVTLRASDPAVFDDITQYV